MELLEIAFLDDRGYLYLPEVDRLKKFVDIVDFKEE